MRKRRCDSRATEGTAGRIGVGRDLFISVFAMGSAKSYYRPKRLVECMNDFMQFCPLVATKGDPNCPHPHQHPCL